jgi:hypothetical protein
VTTAAAPSVETFIGQIAGAEGDDARIREICRDTMRAIAVERNDSRAAITQALLPYRVALRARDDHHPALAYLSTARERVEVFIDRLRDAGDDRRRIYAVCRNEIRWLKTGYALTTARRSVTRYRDAIRAAYGEDAIALRHMRLSAQDQETVAEMQRAKTVADNLNLIPIDDEAMVTKAEELLNSNHFLDLSIGIGLVTGRRKVEILNAGRFAPDAEDRADYITFTGQAKTRGSVNAMIVPYAIPTLVNAVDVLAAIDRLHVMRPDLRTDAYPKVDNSTKSDINIRVKKHFGPDFSFKDLRSAYAAIAYAWFAPEEISQNAFYAKILGHAPGDITTALSYADYYVAGAKRNTVSRQIKDFRELLTTARVRLAETDNETTRGNLEREIARLEAALTERGGSTRSIRSRVLPADVDRAIRQLAFDLRRRDVEIFVGEDTGGFEGALARLYVDEAIIVIDTGTTLAVITDVDADEIETIADLELGSDVAAVNDDGTQWSVAAR